MTISSERLEEMLAACDALEPLDWVATPEEDPDDCVSHIIRPMESDCHGVRYLPIVPRIELPIIRGAQSKEDNERLAKHFANCGPYTIRELITELQALRQAAGNIMPYLRWTISDESPGHHPTMPSAVAEFASLTNHQEPSNAG